ncbi:hypothetical protein LZ30DRAFT_611272, partial [Colletotrichum cereale]
IEPVGLAVSIIGLGSLFSTYLEAVKKFNSYKNFNYNLYSLATILNANKHCFRYIKKGKLSNLYHSALNNIKNLAVVYKLLASI